jgi:UDP-N-acetylglucosamine--N-acetylmuramyl-(pentapeptide) pyrophosphoryl-undecaprenol N-acetylglucosamine transferase
LGARTINKSIIRSLKDLNKSDVQLIWQSGRYYFNDILTQHSRELQASEGSARLTKFIERMDLAYSVADLIISRAGAGSISEFCFLGKAVILVPSPNVAEDHQTKNAQALVDKKAAILIPDRDALEKLVPEALKIVRDDDLLNELRTNILKIALPDSANKIVDEIDNILQK